MQHVASTLTSEEGAPCWSRSGDGQIRDCSVASCGSNAADVLSNSTCGVFRCEGGWARQELARLIQ